MIRAQVPRPPVSSVTPLGQTSAERSRSAGPGLGVDSLRHSLGRVDFRPPLSSAVASPGAPIQLVHGGGGKIVAKLTTRERLRRARERQEKRGIHKRSRKHWRFARRAGRHARWWRRGGRAKLGLQTPFGPVNLVKFPTKDPGAKITTIAKNYGKQSVGHKYSDLIEALRVKGVKDHVIARDLLRATKHREPTLRGIKTMRQKNAAAKLLTIPHLSERQRVPGSDKAFRATLRMISKKKATLEEGFTGDTPLYPMAKTPTYMRRLVNYENKKLRKKPVKPKKFDELTDYFSDSSDDESG